MKITITKTDWKKANKAVAAGAYPRDCCVVVQALKRHGIAVDYVGYSVYYSGRMSYYLPKEAQFVTALPQCEWDEAIGVAFTI